MPDIRRAKDVPDEFRREFIRAYFAEHAFHPFASQIYAAWEKSQEHHPKSQGDNDNG